MELPLRAGQTKTSVPSRKWKKSREYSGRLKQLSCCTVWELFFLVACVLKLVYCSFNCNISAVSTSLYVSNLFVILKQ
jgi:hypothetical protein